MPTPANVPADAAARRDRLREILRSIPALAAERAPGARPPSCFVSYAWGDRAHGDWVERLAGDLRACGVDVLLDRWHNAAPGSSIARYIARVVETDWVLVVGTPAYRDKTDNLDSEHGRVAAAESDLFSARLQGTEAKKRTVIPVLRAGDGDAVFPPLLHGRVFADLRDDDAYDTGLVDVVLTLYRIPFDREPVPGWRRELGAAAAPPGVAAGPPPRSLRLHNLVRSGDLFIGREEELAEILRLLDHHRLVTLTGVGGCGKSRLAEEVALRLVDCFPDGVWLTRLAAVGDPLLVPQSIAAALGLREQAAAPPTQILADFLEDREALLVLDNCEHLIDACAQVARELLERCRGVRLLATSRRPVLGGPRERLFEVPPLNVPPEKGWSLEELGRYESVRLFVETGAALPRRDGFLLDRTNASAVARICRQLDGIPLAIELAAARLEHLSAEEIAEYLGRAFKLLRGDRRSDPRQRSLLTTLDWSHDLLGDDDRRLFARLGIFAGGATREDLAAVCGDDGLDELDLIDSLERLVNHSLVLVGPAGEGRTRRYSMHEVVRQYSHLQLERSGELPGLARQHRDRFLDLAGTAAPKLLGAEQDRWLARLEADHANLRQALLHSLETGEATAALALGARLWRFWEIRAYFNEGRRRLAALLALPAARNEALWAEVASGAGMLAFRQGDFDESARWAGRALEIERALGNAAGVANALNDLGIVASRRGRFDEAFEFYRASLDLKRKVDDDRQMGVALFNVGLARLRSGFPAEALSDLCESLARFRRAGATWDSGFPLYALGLVALVQGDADRARTRFREALDARVPSDDKKGMADALAGLGLTEVRLGERAAAGPWLARALELRAEVGDRPGKVETLEAVAEWALGGGAAARAAELAAAADRFRTTEGLPLAPVFVPAHERLAAAFAERLDDDALAAARATAETLDLDDAMELARELLAAATAAGPAAETGGGDG